MAFRVIWLEYRRLPCWSSCDPLVGLVNTSMDMHQLCSSGRADLFSAWPGGLLAAGTVVSWNRLKAIFSVRLSNSCVVGPFVDLLYLARHLQPHLLRYFSFSWDNFRFWATIVPAELAALIFGLVVQSETAYLGRSLSRSILSGTTRSRKASELPNQVLTFMRWWHFDRYQYWWAASESTVRWKVHENTFQEIRLPWYSHGWISSEG